MHGMFEVAEKVRRSVTMRTGGEKSLRVVRLVDVTPGRRTLGLFEWELGKEDDATWDGLKEGEVADLSIRQITGFFNGIARVSARMGNGS